MISFYRALALLVLIFLMMMLFMASLDEVLAHHLGTEQQMDPHPAGIFGLVVCSVVASWFLFTKGKD